jgi:beta-galactosidase
MKKKKILFSRRAEALAKADGRRPPSASLCLCAFAFLITPNQLRHYRATHQKPADWTGKLNKKLMTCNASSFRQSLSVCHCARLHRFSNFDFMPLTFLRALLIAAALVFPAPCLLASPDSPRERLLFDFGWKLHLGDAPDATNQFDYPEVADVSKTRVPAIGQEGELADLSDAVKDNVGANVSFVQPGFDDRGWRTLDLPHDWAVELPFDPKAEARHGFKPLGPGFPQNSIGWYRREFALPASDKGKVLWLEFDGVYRNSLVWLNGHCLGRHLSGYTGFRYDLSQYANYGGKNELVVRVDASRFEGWFYEGAGIYRHVWLEKTSPVTIVPDGVFVWSEFENNNPKGLCKVHIQTQLLNLKKHDVVKCEIIAPDHKSLGKIFETLYGKSRSSRKTEAEILFFPTNTSIIDSAAHGVEIVNGLGSPQLWSPESPNLYKLITTVESDGKVVDREETSFGIRTVAFDSTNGFLLNGKRYQIQGTCNHQDHAGVGTAMPDALQYYRVKKLKEMGCNAIRTSHNEPTPELLDACDRLGLLVMDENRRMDDSLWESNELSSLVLRDRNHPSVFIWSLGNEEAWLQGTRGTNATLTPEIAQAAGTRVTRAMQDLAHELDPTRLCTVAMNGAWGYGISTVIDVQGFNYRTYNVDKFRQKFPDKLTIGTETASTRVTRGIYADDKAAGYLAAYGTNGTERAWDWWPYYATHPFTSGGFVWTGFDYRGEPIPYKWPCISSHFGLMDTCGFPKDIYYYYQSWWTDQPVLHLMPHWNWAGDEGKKICVRVFSNCKEGELFLNGKSLGRQTMQPNWFLDWNVAYAPGVLSAKGYDAHGNVIAQSKVETTGAPATVTLEPDRATINADGEDLSIITVSVRDVQGRVVPTASNLVHFTLQGPGKIIGVGNGDPSCHEPDKYPAQTGWQRSAFCGLAQIIVQSSKDAGNIHLTATADGLPPATISLQSQTCEPRPSVP